MSEEKTYQICKRCVMDTTDVNITFDENGICSHCQKFDLVVKPKWFPNAEGKKRLDAIIEEIKLKGKNSKYDCVIGLSGGVDSSYLAYMLRTEYPELRILAIHIDAGWNSELAVQNIENIVQILDIDLHTEVIDWEIMKDLHLAYLKSSVPDQDIPQDNAFFATLYKEIDKFNIKYFLSGENIASESILPYTWGYTSLDGVQIKAIHKQFGELKNLGSYTTLSLFKKRIYYPKIKGFKIINPLDYWDYDKEREKQLLMKELNWKDYGGKHHESRFTKFFQNFYLPSKFGFDKRKAHLSSLILAEQLTREEALKKLEEPLYDDAQLAEDKEFIAKKLGISTQSFEELINLENKKHSDYPTEWDMLKPLVKLKQTLKKLLKK